MSAHLVGRCPGMERTPQIHRVSVADQVAAVLRQRILNGELRPGMPLPEMPLAASLGVSRNTMREATRILSLEGLLKRNAHRGVAVCQLGARDVQEIYLLRRMLEISAVLAARPSRTEILGELRHTLAGYESATQDCDWARAVEFDLQFHTLLIRFHQNRRLECFYQRVIGELRMGMVLVDRGHDDHGRLAPVHRRIFQLLSVGKLKPCAALLLQHLDDSESRLMRVMNENSSPQKPEMPGTEFVIRRSKGRSL